VWRGGWTTYSYLRAVDTSGTQTGRGANARSTAEYGRLQLTTQVRSPLLPPCARATAAERRGRRVCRRQSTPTLERPRVLSGTPARRAWRWREWTVGPCCTSPYASSSATSSALPRNTGTRSCKPAGTCGVGRWGEGGAVRGRGNALGAVRGRSGTKRWRWRRLRTRRRRQGRGGRRRLAKVVGGGKGEGKGEGKGAPRPASSAHRPRRDRRTPVFTATRCEETPTPTPPPPEASGGRRRHLRDVRERRRLVQEAKVRPRVASPACGGDTHSQV
jgi:hypothetical protein